MSKATEKKAKPGKDTKTVEAPVVTPPSPLVRLKNLTPKPLALNLDHKSVCVKTGTCLCTKQTRQVPVIVDGMAGTRSESKLICSSITLSGGASEKFSRDVLLAADVKSGIESGIIRDLSTP